MPSRGSCPHDMTCWPFDYIGTILKRFLFFADDVWLSGAKQVDEDPLLQSQQSLHFENA